jgi:hypothetical protein
MIPGAGTSLETAWERAREFMHENDKKVTAVVILYNSTQGLPNDLIEAVLNFFGFELAVGRELKGELIELLEGCRENQITFQMDFICHSHGVAIADIIRHAPEFQGQTPLRGYLGNVVNLGGSKYVAGTSNYAALGDPVSILAALLNLPATINALFNGELHFVCPTTLEFPHNFSGSAYQGAIADYMHERSCQ